jgi:superfamily I DNA/RNA helicase
MFIAGDAHQRIYDGRVSLASVGIETRGRSRRLKLNYRTSQQILGWALGILTGRQIDDLDGNAERQAGYRSEFQGPPPIVRTFSSASDESSFVAETVKEWIASGVPAGAIGVLARTRGAYAGVVEALGRLGIGTSEIGKKFEPGTIFIGTMHASKGLEFARLAVVGASANMVPLPASVTPSTEDPARHELDITRERCLLYVACTRARDTLVVTSVGSPSPFLPSIAS